MLTSASRGSAVKDLLQLLLAHHANVNLKCRVRLRVGLEGRGDSYRIAHLVPFALSNMRRSFTFRRMHSVFEIHTYYQQ